MYNTQDIHYNRLSSCFVSDFSQLFYDGYQTLALNLATTVKAHPACSPSDRLMKVVQLGLREEEGKQLKVSKCLTVYPAITFHS